MKENKKKKLLLEDMPVEKEEMDEFKHNIFVDVLLELIKDVNGPCNIGLFGKWGTGKTSIVKILFNRIKNDEEFSKRMKCLYFDAWKYSDESLRTQTLLELDEGLGEKIGRDKIIDDLYNIREEEIPDKPMGFGDRIWKVLFELRVSLIALATMIVIDLFILILSDTRIADVVTTLIIVPVLVELIFRVQSAGISMSKKRILPKKEWSGEFERIFREIVKQAGEEKIVIAIDNLDRCQSKTVMEMLALLKTFMDIQKCIYIIPCDEEALLSHIDTLDSSRGYFKESRQEFLRKIFQVSIKIPPFLGENLEEYAQKLISQMRFSFDENVQDVIVRAYAKTPRQIVHILNKLTVLYLLAKEKEEERIIKKGTVTNNLPFLAKIAIIEDEWRDFYNELSNNPLLLDEIENYLRGKPLNDTVMIEQHFKDNPLLKDFLNATRAVRSENVEPFLLLSQEKYEYSIPEQERFILYLYQNDVDQVRNTMDQLSDSKKIDHAKLILKNAGKKIRGKRFSSGFNCLNVLSHIYNTIPDNFRVEAAREFGQYIDTAGMRELATSFDYEKLFQILPLMNEVNRDNVLAILASNIILEKRVDAVLVQKFIEHSDIIGDDARRKLNDVIIGMLNSENPRAGEEAISLISKDVTAKKNLVEQRLLVKLIERITVNESGKQENVNLYMQLDSVADQETRERLISKELDFLGESKIDRSSKVKHVLDVLGKLELDYISSDLADKLYSQLKNETRQLPPNQRLDYLRFMFRNLRFLTDSNRDDFLRSDIREILVKGNPDEANSVMGTALNTNVEILYDEKILNALLERIPTEIFQSNVLEYLIRHVPEKQEIIKNKLVDILRGGDLNKTSQALKAIKNQFTHFEKTYKDEIARICIDISTRPGNPGQKDAVVDCVISFLKTQATRKIGKKHYDLIRNHLEKGQKERLASELLQGLLTIPDEELNGGTKPLIEVLFDLKSVMNTAKIRSFIENILRMLKGSLKPEQIKEGILYLKRFENFYGLEDTVLDQISKATKHNDNGVSTTANRVLTFLQEKKRLRRSKSDGHGDNLPT